MEENATEKIVEAEPAVSAQEQSKIKRFLHRFKDRKFLIQISLPILIIVLLIIGLWRQGVFAEAFSGLFKASLTVTVSTSENEPVENATVVISSKNTVTGADGKATLDDLRSGSAELAVRKTGFEPNIQQIKLKKGDNSIAVTLEETPVAKVTLTLSVIDYIDETVIDDAVIQIGDIKPIFANDVYTFSDVPIGKITLKVERSGYRTFSTDVTIEEDSSELDKVMLVKDEKIVFESNRDGGYRGIYTSNIDGTDQKLLVERVGNYEDYSPMLNSSRSYVIFTSTRDGQKSNNGTGYNPAVYLVGLDGKDLKKVIEPADTYHSYSWSRNGQFVGISYYEPGSNNGVLKVYNVSSGKVATFEADRGVNSFVFSADGNKVFYSTYSDTGGTNKLYSAPSQGGERVQIGENAWGGLELTSSNNIRYYNWANGKTSYYEYNPSNNTITSVDAFTVNTENRFYGAIVSPDKKYRVYSAERDGRSNIFRSDADGKNEVQLTTIGNTSYQDIHWGSDSSFVIFSVKSSSETAKYVVGVGGKSKAKKIVDINSSYN